MKIVKTISVLFLLIFYVGLAEEIKKEGFENEEAREKWFNEINRAEPGVNWKAIQSEVFRAKAEVKNSFIKHLKLKGKYTDQLLGETDIAEGHLQGTWQERGSANQAGRIHTVDVDFDKELIYAASSGGNIWRGTLEGKNWTSLNDYRKFNIVTLKIIKIGNSTRIFIFDRLAPYYSDDNGQTWQKSEYDAAEGVYGILNGTIRRGGNNCLYFLGVAPSNKIKLMESKDNGTSFQKIAEYTSDNQNGDIASANSYETDVFYFVNGTLYSVDNGHTIHTYGSIQDYNSISDQVHLINVAVCSNFVITALSTSSGTYIYRGDKPGYAISNIALNSQERLFMEHSLAISEKDFQKVMYGGVEAYYSNDGGYGYQLINDWTDYYKNPTTKLHADIPSIQSFMDKSGTDWIFYCTDGGLFLAKNNPLVINNISMYGLNVSQYYSVYTSKLNYNYIFAGAQDQGFQRNTNDSGSVLAFEQVLSGDYGHVNSINGGADLWLIYPGAIYFGKNITVGKNLTSITMPQGNRAWIPPVAIYPDNASQALIACGEPGKSTIQKVSYEFNKLKLVSLPFNFAVDNGYEYVSAIRFSPFNNNKVYALTSHGRFFESDDQGVGNWSQKSIDIGYNSDYLYGSVVLPSAYNENTIYVAGSGISNPAVYISNDGGKSFKDMSSGLEKCTVYEMVEAYGGNVLFAATSKGPYVYLKSLEKWYDMSGITAPQQVYWSVDWLPDANTVRFGTYGRGIWDFKITSIDDVKEQVSQRNESKFSIEAYPNPATSKLNLRIKSAKARTLDIRIYDINGKIVDFTAQNLPVNGSEEISLGTFIKSGILSGTYTVVASSEGEVEYTLIKVQK